MKGLATAMRSMLSSHGPTSSESSNIECNSSDNDETVQQGQKQSKEEDEVISNSRMNSQNPLLQLSEDLHLVIFHKLSPADTSSLLRTAKLLSKSSTTVWKEKTDALSDKYTLPYVPVNRDSDQYVSETKHWRVELSKRYQRMVCYRPVIEGRWREPPYWYPDHPQPPSPFNAVRRAHDVTDFRISATTDHLEAGWYKVHWRVNSTSGFCDLQMESEVFRGEPTLLAETGADTHLGDEINPPYSRTARWSSTWSARNARGSGWKTIAAFDDVVRVWSGGGYIKSRLWKSELDFTGGILVDYMKVEKVEPAPTLMNSGLLMSSW